MFEAQTINADHKDLIHDVAYDFYGERMATCSSDQFVKIWDVDSKGVWQVSASWKAHSGSVWKVTWAHPEFGQVIATSSFDRTAAIWEEVGDTTIPGERGLRQWIRRTNLVDSRTSVTDIKFGPKTLGLMLATCSADGIIRIYEAPDVMNLAQWTLQHEIPTKVPLSCLSWNPSLSRELNNKNKTLPGSSSMGKKDGDIRAHPPMIAVGSDEASTGSVAGTTVGSSGSSSSGRVFIYEYSEVARRWARTDCLATVTDPVHDIVFAPNLGRSYHLLAIATKNVRIISLKPIIDNSNAQNGTVRYETNEVAVFDDHYATVWRVSWNVTGTILASSGDDGCVRLWKMHFFDKWKCVAILKGDGSCKIDSSNVSGTIPPMALSQPAATTRYYKLGNITNPNQVPWH